MNNMYNIHSVWHNGIEEIYPSENMVKAFRFESGEEEEANLADAMAKVASKTGMSQNDLKNLFPSVLRMLKYESVWTR